MLFEKDVGEAGNLRDVRLGGNLFGKNPLNLGDFKELDRLLFIFKMSSFSFEGGHVGGLPDFD